MSVLRKTLVVPSTSLTYFDNAVLRVESFHDYHNKAAAPIANHVFAIKLVCKTKKITSVTELLLINDKRES